MPVISLLNGLQNAFVDAEADGGRQREEWGVGQHGDHGAAGQGHQEGQASAQGGARSRRVPPVD